jgi:hypothetical protein
MAKHTEPIDDVDYYSDDPDGFNKQPQKKKLPAVLAFLLLLFGGSYLVQTTLAANISLNSGGPVEFGQGITATVACSGATDLTITPNATFTNASGGGSFYFSSVRVSNIPSSCQGKDFTIKAFENTDSTPLAIFNTNSTSAVIYNNAGSFQLGGGSSGISITSGSGTFTITFATPVALASSVFKITIESGEHVEPYSIGSTGPGGGKIFYIASTPFVCGPALELTCTYLEAAPTTGVNSWTDAAYVWSGNTNTLIGTTGTAIGTGYQNTLAMVGQAGGGSTAGRAGTVARAYRGPNNLSDWYLPSKDELNQLYLQRATVGTASGYWSSSEVDATTAWDQGFGNGSQGAGAKTTAGTPVRPIRAF